MNRRTAILGTLLLLQGCAGMYVIPDTLNERLDRSTTFPSLQADPDAYIGRVVPLGGVVLQARNLKEGTEIEILQLPLDRYDRPAGPIAVSEGRFLVQHPGYLETAVFKNGQRVTVVGEVIGKQVRPIDELEYTYPYLKAQFIHVWTERSGYSGYPYYYPYGPYDPYYWPRHYPWGPYWYDPWGPPVIVVPDGEPRPERRLDPSRGSAPPSSKGTKRQLD